MTCFYLDVKSTENWMEGLKKDRLVPDTVTFNPLIGTAAKQGNEKRVQHWLIEMKKVGVRPNVNTFTSLIDAASNRGDNEQIQHWFGEMKECGVQQDVVTFNSLINGAVVRRYGRGSTLVWRDEEVWSTTKCQDIQLLDQCSSSSRR